MKWMMLLVLITSFSTAFANLSAAREEVCKEALDYCLLAATPCINDDFSDARETPNQICESDEEKVCKPCQPPYSEQFKQRICS